MVSSVTYIKTGALRSQSQPRQSTQPRKPQTSCSRQLWPVGASSPELQSLISAALMPIVHVAGLTITSPHRLLPRVFSCQRSVWLRPHSRIRAMCDRRCRQDRSREPPTGGAPTPAHLHPTSVPLQPTPLIPAHPFPPQPISHTHTPTPYPAAIPLSSHPRSHPPARSAQGSVLFFPGDRLHCVCPASPPAPRHKRHCRMGETSHLSPTDRRERS